MKESRLDELAAIRREELAESYEVEHREVHTVSVAFHCPYSPPLPKLTPDPHQILKRRSQAILAQRRANLKSKRIPKSR